METEAPAMRFVGIFASGRHLGLQHSIELTTHGTVDGCTVSSFAAKSPDLVGMSGHRPVMFVGASPVEMKYLAEA